MDRLNDEGSMMSTVRWSVVIPEATDRTLRTFLAQRGMRKGDLFKFVDDAVQARLFELTVDEIKDRNRDLDQDDIMAAVDEALGVERG